MSIQLDFDYYETYGFHKLAMKIDKRNSFSVLHTNICSISANLDHAFDVVGVSESWTSENDNKNTMNNHTIPGYQKFCGTKGSLLKSG